MESTFPLLKEAALRTIRDGKGRPKWANLKKAINSIKFQVSADFNNISLYRNDELGVGFVGIDYLNGLLPDRQQGALGDALAMGWFHWDEESPDLSDIQSLVKIAKIEYVKAQLFCIFKSVYIEAESRLPGDFSAEEWLQTVEHDRDWLNANESAILPPVQPFFQVRSTDEILADWLFGYHLSEADFVKIVSSPKWEKRYLIHQVLIALLLVWFDEVIGSRTHSSELFPMIAFVNGLAARYEIYTYDAVGPSGPDFRALGRKGGKQTHRETNDLKGWALAEAKQMMGSDMEIARTLAGRLPSQLLRVSKDPERLIYDALRTLGRR